MLASGQKNTGHPAFLAIFHARMHLLLDITPFMAILQEFFLCFLPCKKACPKHTVLEGFFGIFLQKMAILQEFFWVFLPCKKARPKHNVLEGFFAFFHKKVLPDSCQNPWIRWFWVVSGNFFWGQILPDTSFYSWHDLSGATPYTEWEKGQRNWVFFKLAW